MNGIMLYSSFVFILCINYLSLVLTANINSDSVLQDNDITLSKANAKFAIDFYQQLIKSPEMNNSNVCMSPFNIFSSLTLLSLGAVGNTKTQIEKALNIRNLSLTNSELGILYGNILKYLISNDNQTYFNASEDLNKSPLQLANGLFIEDSFDLKEKFRNDVLTYFKAKFEKCDFKNQALKSVDKINQWVSEQTNNRIQNLIKPELITEFTELIIVSAIYLKTLWLKGFDQDNTELNFFYSNGKAIGKVHMMSQGAKEMYYGYSEDLDCTVVEMLSKEDSYRFYFILPNQMDGLPIVESKLNVYHLTKPRKAFNMRASNFDLSIPAFKNELKFNMNNILKILGINDLFIPGQANLGDLTGDTQNNTKLSVSDTIHVAFVEINERGAEMAGASGIVLTNRMASFKMDSFNADHPFLYYILHEPTETVLFIGRFSKPEK